MLGGRILCGGSTCFGFRYGFYFQQQTGTQEDIFENFRRKNMMFAFMVRRFVSMTSCHFAASKEYLLCIKPKTLSILLIKITFIR